MSRQLRSTIALILCATVVCTGCHPTQPFYLNESPDLQHYLDHATSIETPDVETAHLAEVEQAQSPLTVSNPEFREFWDLKLEECVSMAMHNSKVIRNAASIQANFGFSDALVGRTAQLPTVYDSAIVETNTGGGAHPVQGGVRGGNGTSPFPSGPVTSLSRANGVPGVEDALSEFDAQFYAGMSYDKTDRAQNSRGVGNVFQPQQFLQDNTDFLAAISKKTATGAVFSLRNRTEYTFNNLPIGTSRAVPSDWFTSVEAEVNYPWLRGRGEQVNRIPVVLARINTDISLADFESAVRNLLMDTENAYWDLHNSYRALEAAKIGRDSAQVTWKLIHEKLRGGVQSSMDEAQAKGQYFQFRAAVETALKDLYNTENRLRWLMGLAATDGRLIRPIDEPTTARVDFNWDEVHGEALFRSPELRQQKWRIKQRELELISARNHLLPQLNTGLGYRWLGRGDELINADRNGQDFSTDPVGSTAFDELTGGQYGEAFFQLDFIPARFGMRRELSMVRNAQLQIARAHAHLEEMELNQSHLLSQTIRDLDSNYVIAQSNFNWWVAEVQEVRANEELLRGGKTTVDRVLDAQRQRAQAQAAYYRALTDYNKSLALVHYRKGSLLEHNNVYLAEGPWPAKAYWDSIEKARAASAGIPLDYGWTRPGVISQGELQQHEGTSEKEATGGIPTPAELPTPAAQPAPEATDPPAEPAPPTPPGPITRAAPAYDSPNRLRGTASPAAYDDAAEAAPVAEAATEVPSRPVRSNTLRK